VIEIKAMVEWWCKALRVKVRPIAIYGVLQSRCVEVPVMPFNKGQIELVTRTPARVITMIAQAETIV
jgi:hypothetical protein